MAEIKKRITQLDPALGPLAGTEVSPVVQGGVTKKIAEASKYGTGWWDKLKEVFTAFKAPDSDHADNADTLGAGLEDEDDFHDAAQLTGVIHLDRIPVELTGKNASTADYADTAGAATTADYATEAGSSSVSVFIADSFSDIDNGVASLSIGSGGLSVDFRITKPIAATVEIRNTSTASTAGYLKLDTKGGYGYQTIVSASYSSTNQSKNTPVFLLPGDYRIDRSNTGCQVTLRPLSIVGQSTADPSPIIPL